MNPLNIIYGALSAAIVGAIAIYIWNCENAKDFKDKAVVLAEAARDSAIKEMTRTKLLKEKTDAEIKRLAADNITLDQRLRDERARGRAMSKPAHRAPSPERACFRGPIIDAAITRFIEDASAANGQLDAELSAIVREGEAARISLDGAKRWAQSLSSNAPPPRQ